MRVLLDEQVLRLLGPYLIGQEVRTVANMGWKGLENGALLRRAAEQFDALISMDRRMPEQQDLSAYRIGLILLRAASNRVEDLSPLAPQILAALQVVRPGELHMLP